MLCDLEGWDGWEVGGRFKREGTYVYIWLIHIDVWQKPTQHCKAIIFQLKINFKKMTILKSRDITLKLHLVKAIIFPVVMYGCESWTIKKVEH